VASQPGTEAVLGLEEVTLRVGRHKHTLTHSEELRLTLKDKLLSKIIG